MSRFINPIPFYTFAPGGTLAFYEYGTDTLLTIYGDENETITIDNPVGLGDLGQVPNIFFSVAARAVLKKAGGETVFDVQPVSLAGGGSGGVSGWTSNATYGQLAITYASDGDFYISLVNDNVANDPTDDTDDSQYWTRLELLRFWNAQESFDTGSLAVRGTKIFYSTIDENIGNDPSVDTTGNWKDINSADISPYNNSASGLAATNVKTAIDELVTIINAITQPLVYKGTLDVSGGDASLPASPSNGDLYIIGIGGTITVSTNGGATTPTAVTTGERIVWNNSAGRWDLIPFSETAASISYSNVLSGLAANNVQDAVDELSDSIDTNASSIATINSIIAGYGAGVVYKGALDVSGGDSSLPASPSNGDLYAITVGGTITVSVNGAAPALTPVTAGQQIIYNGDLIQWDLQASVVEAGEISFDNAASGLTAVDVQSAIDEIVADGKDSLLITNWDAQLESGFCRTQLSTGQSGSPNDSLFGWVGIVIKLNANNVAQIVWEAGSLDVQVYSRFYSGSSWTDWTPVYTGTQPNHAVNRNAVNGFAMTRLSAISDFNYSELSASESWTIDGNLFFDGDIVYVTKERIDTELTITVSNANFVYPNGDTDTTFTLNSGFAGTAKMVFSVSNFRVTIMG